MEYSLTQLRPYSADCQATASMQFKLQGVLKFAVVEITHLHYSRALPLPLFYFNTDIDTVAMYWLHRAPLAFLLLHSRRISNTLADHVDRAFGILVPSTLLAREDTLGSFH